jgi:hypothetical protein
MACESCFSARESTLIAEMMLHFSGVEHLANAGMLIFPTVTVCLDCGSSRFTIAETELQVIREETARSRAA